MSILRMGKAEDYRGPASAVMILRNYFKYLIDNGWILNQKLSINTDLNSDKWSFTAPKKLNNIQLYRKSYIYWRSQYGLIPRGLPRL